MAKPTTLSPERAALAVAHQQLAACRASLAQAEDAQREALSAWGAADRAPDGSDRLGTDILEQLLTGLLARKDPGLYELRHQHAREVEAARAELLAAEEKLKPYHDVYKAAGERIPELQRAVDAAQQQVNAAARRVVAVEAAPVARAAMEQLHKLFVAMLEVAPDLAVMLEKSILPPDFVYGSETPAAQLLQQLSRTPELAARCRHSPWRVAFERLQEDPGAPLPTAAAS